MKTIEELTQIVEKDSDDVDAQVQLLMAKARVYGSNELLTPTFNYLKWKDLPIQIQDLAIAEIARRLGVDYHHSGTFDWGVYNKDLGNINFRLPVFVHTHLEIEFTLIPALIVFAEPGDFIELRHCQKYGVRVEGKGEGLGRYRLGHFPFLIGRWPVTKVNWLKQTNTQNKVAALNLPMTNITAIEAIVFLRKFGMNLPTYQQWRDACYGGVNTKYFWGDDFNSTYVHCSSLFRRSPQSPEDHDKAFAWNAYGLVDMLGNVDEFVKRDGSIVTMGGCYSSHPTQFERWQEPTENWIQPSTSKDSSTGFRAAKIIPGLE